MEKIPQVLPYTSYLLTTTSLNTPEQTRTNLNRGGTVPMKILQYLSVHSVLRTGTGLLPSPYCAACTVHLHTATRSVLLGILHLYT